MHYRRSEQALGERGGSRIRWRLVGKGSILMFNRVYTSSNPYEWWNKHMASALSEFLEIIPCQMARHNVVGHPLEANISRLLEGQNGRQSFYLGSWDQLFRGIGELAMPTAVWTDFFALHTLDFLPCLKLYDVVFCTQRDSVKFLKHAGISQAEWLPFGFDACLQSRPELEKLYDVAFVGSLNIPATRDERLALLSAIEGRYRMNEYRKPVFGNEMMEVYNRCRIAVNIPWSGGLNMRTFEVMAAGALLLTKAVGNGQEELFQDGVHLVTYRDADDLLAKIDYYLRNENERNRIATTGMCEVIEKHSYRHRAEKIISVMHNARRTRTRSPRERSDAYEVYYNYVGRADLLAGLAFYHGVPFLTRLRLLARCCWKLRRHVTQVRKEPL